MSSEQLAPKDPFAVFIVIKSKFLYFLSKIYFLAKYYALFYLGFLLYINFHFVIILAHSVFIITLSFSIIKPIFIQVVLGLNQLKQKITFKYDCRYIIELVIITKLFTIVVFVILLKPD